MTDLNILLHVLLITCWLIWHYSRLLKVISFWIFGWCCQYLGNVHCCLFTKSSHKHVTQSLYSYRSCTNSSSVGLCSLTPAASVLLDGWWLQSFSLLDSQTSWVLQTALIIDVPVTHTHTASSRACAVANMFDTCSDEHFNRNLQLTHSRQSVMYRVKLTFWDFQSVKRQNERKVTFKS